MEKCCQERGSIHVLLVDDHPIVRAGIRALLENGSHNILVIGEASDGRGALQMTVELSPHVLLLDMELPDMNGIEVAKQVFELHRETKILALSAYSDLFYVHGLLDVGVSGYLVKEEAPEIIVQAVVGVAQGEKGWFSRQIVAQLPVLMSQGKPQAESAINLSPRERQVLEAVVDGKTNAAIASQLGISLKTIEKHLNSIYFKLGVVSRVEAAICAIRSRIV